MRVAVCSPHAPPRIESAAFTSYVCKVCLGSSVGFFKQRAALDGPIAHYSIPVIWYRTFFVRITLTLGYLVVVLG